VRSGQRATIGAHIQERLESRGAGQLLISAFIVITLAAVSITNLPDSRLRQDAAPVANRYLNATGLDQSWNVFAPEPRRQSIAFEARVRFADGSFAIWRPPAGSRLAGAYWDYRWRKWLENVIQDAHREMLWRPAALFAADQVQRSGHRPTKVTLVRRWRDLRPPGSRRPSASSARSYRYYQLDLTNSARVRSAR
jgi:hypothetical protein